MTEGWTWLLQNPSHLLTVTSPSQVLCRRPSSSYSSAELESLSFAKYFYSTNLWWGAAETAAFRNSHRLSAVHPWGRKWWRKSREWSKAEAWFLRNFSKPTNGALLASTLYLYSLRSLASAATCGFYMIFTFLRFSFSRSRFVTFVHSELFGVPVHIVNIADKNLLNKSMETQLLLTRPESPVIIITTTSYNPPQTLATVNHSAVSGNAMHLHQMNAQYNGNNLAMMEQQQQQHVQQQQQQQQIQQQQQSNGKSRICRDFVRGACRRLYCKVRSIKFPLFINLMTIIRSIPMCSLPNWSSFVMISRTINVHESTASELTFATIIVPALMILLFKVSSLLDRRRRALPEVRRVPDDPGRSQREQPEQRREHSTAGWIPERV